MKRDFVEFAGVENCSGEMNVAFPIEEYKNRLTKIRRLMEKENIDLLYVTSPENMNYISGYNPAWHRVNSSSEWSDSTTAGIAIHVDYDKFILYDLPDEEGVIKCSSISSDTRIFYDTPGEMFGKSYEYVTEDTSFKELVINNLAKEGWIKGRVALELGSYRPSALEFMALKELFENRSCEVVDGTKIVREARKIKSPLELQYIETATHITDIGMKAIKSVLEPGITELEIVGAYTEAMCRAGGENAGIVNMVRSGPNRSWGFHHLASRRKIMYGDPVGIDLAGVYYRYHSNQCRYFCVGHAPKEFYEIYRRNQKVMEMAKALFKPNMMVSKFLKEINRFYKEEGVLGKQYFTGGYELGIAYPPDWVGEFTYCMVDDIDNDSKIFEPGMVVNFETGFGLIDTVMFKEDEATILGKTPWELEIIE